MDSYWWKKKGQEAKTSKKTSSPRTAIIWTIIRHDEHDLPLKYVVFYETATNAGDKFVRWHLLELAGKQSRSWGACRAYTHGMMQTRGSTDVGKAMSVKRWSQSKSLSNSEYVAPSAPNKKTIKLKFLSSGSHNELIFVRKTASKTDCGSIHSL